MLTILLPQISIHAPAWGATNDIKKYNTKINEFQSTHPRGVRRDIKYTLEIEEYISIHAPAWGATPGYPHTVLIVEEFQSTHPRGVRRLSQLRL